jgi:flavin reductase
MMDSTRIGGHELDRPTPRHGGRLRAVAEAKSVEQKVFREAMSRLGAAVHVITTDGHAGKTGFTATAVVLVSDAPPTLLVCLNLRRHQYADPAR